MQLIYTWEANNETFHEEWGKIVTVETDDKTEVDADLNLVITVPTTVRTTEPAPVILRSGPRR